MSRRARAREGAWTAKRISEFPSGPDESDEYEPGDEGNAPDVQPSTINHPEESHE